MQIFIVNEGGGSLLLDEKNEQKSAPFIIYIPDDVIHGFDWKVGSTGYVLSISSSAIRHLAQNIGGMQFISDTAVISLDDSNLNVVNNLCKALSHEQRGSMSLQSAMFISILQILLILLFRLKPTLNHQVTNLSKPEHKLAQFKKLIKQFAVEQHQVGWFAQHIGVSNAHLNQICQHHANSTALSLIHKHILDEAKRLLIFADLRITAIADRLGFQEQSYFTKFFKKLTGQTPSNYRKNFRE